MLKVAMVGMGGISRSHIEGWGCVEDAAIVAVCDVREENAKDAAARTGARAYFDWRAMLDAERPDILDICVPTYLHADIAVEALERGIHVLTEKPISLKYGDVRRVYDAAQKADRRFMVAQVLRFWREYVALKQICESGVYGKLLSGHMTRLSGIPRWSWDGWMQDPERSGMTPFDLHIHDLDFLIDAFGRPQNMLSRRARNEKQDYFEAIYEYPGFFISVEAAWYNCAYPFGATFRFQFEEAVVEYRDGTMRTYLADGRVETLPQEVAQAVNGINLPPSNAYANEIAYFANCVRTGAPCDRVRPEQLETVLELLEKL